MSTREQNSVAGVALREAIVAGAAMVLGLSLVISSQRFPAGLGDLPGPGFFPLVLGIFVVCFAGMIAVEARRKTGAAAKASAAVETEAGAGLRTWQVPLIATILVGSYLAIWELVPFLVRTPVLALLLMRLAGASWRQSFLATVLLTVFLYLVFPFGLRVNLD